MHLLNISSIKWIIICWKYKRFSIHFSNWLIYLKWANHFLYIQKTVTFKYYLQVALLIQCSKFYKLHRIRWFLRKKTTPLQQLSRADAIKRPKSPDLWSWLAFISAIAHQSKSSSDWWAARPIRDLTGDLPNWPSFSIQLCSFKVRHVFFLLICGNLKVLTEICSLNMHAVRKLLL